MHRSLLRRALRLLNRTQLLEKSTITPELLTFLDSIKGEDITTLYGFIDEAEKRRQSSPNEAPFYEAVKTALEDAINLHSQNRVFVFRDDKLEFSQ